MQNSNNIDLSYKVKCVSWHHSSSSVIQHHALPLVWSLNLYISIHGSYVTNDWVLTNNFFFFFCYSPMGWLIIRPQNDVTARRSNLFKFSNYRAEINFQVLQFTRFSVDNVCTISQRFFFFFLNILSTQISTKCTTSLNSQNPI